MRKVRLAGYGLALFLVVCALSGWWWTHRPYAVARRAYDEIHIGMCTAEVDGVFARWGMTEPPPLEPPGVPLIAKEELIGPEYQGLGLEAGPVWWDPHRTDLCAVKGKYYVVCDLGAGKVWNKHLLWLAAPETLFDRIARWLHL